MRERDGAALPAIGDPAPDFAITDTDGNTVRLADRRGRAVVLFFMRAFT